MADYWHNELNIPNGRVKIASHKFQRLQQSHQREAGEGEGEIEDEREEGKRGRGEEEKSGRDTSQ